MPKAIVFDFDGVMVDSEPLHHRATVRVFEPMGLSLSYDEYLRDMVGYDDRDLLRACWGRLHDESQPLSDSELRRLIDVKAEAFEAIVDEGVEPIPGVLAFVRHAAEQLPIAIASGASRRDIELILDKLGLAPLFKVIVSADDVAKSKPDPQTYADAVTQLAAAHPDAGITPETCVAIEDTDAGIQSARGAGLQALGLTTTAGAEALQRAHRVEPSFVGLTVDKLHEWFG